MQALTSNGRLAMVEMKDQPPYLITTSIKILPSSAVNASAHYSCTERSGNVDDEGKTEMLLKMCNNIRFLFKVSPVRHGNVRGVGPEGNLKFLTKIRTR